MTNKTKLVGILNITPDSFSDGGLFFDSDSIFEQVRKLIKDGADIIDIGAQSTRPEAKTLSAKEEWARLSPYLRQAIEICHAFNVKVSIDSFHAQVISNALEYGIDIINDVTGVQNEKVIDAIKHSDCKVVMMHSLTVPADKSVIMNEDIDVIEQLKIFASKQIKTLLSQGISRDRLIFDPGIGFNKTAQQSWEIINRVQELESIGLPLYIGHSRKSFLGDFKTIAEKDQATLKISKQLIHKKIDYIRIHNIKID